MAFSPDLAVDVPLDVIETTALAAVRITAFLVVAPPFANKGVPGPVKVALGLGLALVVQARLPRVATTSVAPLIGDVALQALVGLALGFLVTIAGIAEPPRPEELQRVADQILAGVFDGDLAVALERASAFCAVIAAGRAELAHDRDEVDPEGASGLTRTVFSAPTCSCT